MDVVEETSQQKTSSWDITGASWTKRVNMLTVRHGCGAVFQHPSNRRAVQCPRCLTVEDLFVIKSEISGRDVESMRRYYG